MRRATGREGKLCAETSDNETGANKQTVIRINWEMSVEQIDNDRRHSCIFIDLGLTQLCRSKAKGPKRKAVD